MRKFIVWSQIRSEYGQGVWALVDDVVILKTAFGQKATQRGGHNGRKLAIGEANHAGMMPQSRRSSKTKFRSYTPLGGALNVWCVSGVHRLRGPSRMS